MNCEKHEKKKPLNTRNTRKKKIKTPVLSVVSVVTNRRKGKTRQLDVSPTDYELIVQGFRAFLLLARVF